MDDEAIIERLTEVRGIGRWTVEMLLIFRLGRPDVLPADDLGIRKGFAGLRQARVAERAWSRSAAGAGSPIARSRAGISGAPPTAPRTDRRPPARHPTDAIHSRWSRRLIDR